jgi:pimeloyl-ACP methyl ester carboxylesterase
MATDALALLDRLGIERADVCGSSYGGAIAQHVALAAPARVRSLVLIGTTATRSCFCTVRSAADSNRPVGKPQVYLSAICEKEVSRREGTFVQRLLPGHGTPP